MIATSRDPLYNYLNFKEEPFGRRVFYDWITHQEDRGEQE